MRSVRDGGGVPRNLHGHRFAPPLPESHKLRLAMSSADLQRDLYLADFDRIPVNDQGSVGDCTGQATRNVVSHALMKEHGGVFVFLSAMFVYGFGRLDDLTPLEEDSGCNIPNVINRTLPNHGICREELWPTLDNGVQYMLEPDGEAVADGLTRRGTLSFHIPDDATIAACLEQGFSVSIGLAVYENHMSAYAAQTGEWLFPEAGERALGGHNVVIIGREPRAKIGGRTGRYRLRNSWGEGYGARGDIYAPIDLVAAGLASDGMTVRSVTG